MTPGDSAAVAASPAGKTNTSTSSLTPADSVSEPQPKIDNIGRFHLPTIGVFLISSQRKRRASQLLSCRRTKISSRSTPKTSSPSIVLPMRLHLPAVRMENRTPSISRSSGQRRLPRCLSRGSMRSKGCIHSLEV
jgi:hypothetical protein